MDQWLPSVVLAIGCLGVAQALFLSVYLLTLKTGNRLANIFLAIVLIGLTIRIGKAVVLEFVGLDAWIRNLGISGFLLAGPALWLYGRALLRKEKAFTRRDFRHFIPFILFVLFCGIIPNNRSLLASLFFYATHLHLATYIIGSFVLLNKERSTTPDKISSWYRVISLGVAFILMLYVGIYFRIVPMYLLGATAYTFLVYIFSFVLLKRHHFVLEKYSRSTVDRASSEQLINRLRYLFETEQPFLNSKLSLKDVAEKLSVNPRMLSQVINEYQKSNFSEFVNGYRIEKAKEMLTNPSTRDEKIATIAFDCGFGNVTSFNVEFKSRLDLAPSQYRNQFATV